MRFTLALALALTCVTTQSCSVELGLLAAQPLDDAQLASYLRAYSNVRALVPNLGPPNADMQALKDLNAISVQSIDTAVKKAGLGGYPEFVLLSAKLGAALGVVEAKEIGADVSKRVDAGRAELERALGNPNLPNDAKAKLKEQLEATQDRVQGGKAWANRLLAFVDSFSSDVSQDTVRRHRDELRAAFR